MLGSGHSGAIWTYEWIYFLYPQRDNFAATMMDEGRREWAVHFERFQRMLGAGSIILVGPTLGTINTGIAIFEAEDELRPLRVSLLRGRHEPPAEA